VVCAGAKAILDLARTRELLETLGVPVLGFGTDELPAFYRRASGVPVDARHDTVVDLAAALRTHLALGLGTGVLVGNPIPAADELPAAACDDALARALAEAQAGGVRGRELTPFLLARLAALTGGASVRANLALLRNNARVAGALAAALQSKRGVPAEHQTS
jgi:pseudouridine-5'-phosphate glycosidase